MSHQNLKNIYRESVILRELHHTNIIKLYQVFFKITIKINILKIMETPRLLCVVMEYVPNGEVFGKYINKLITMYHNISSII